MNSARILKSSFRALTAFFLLVCVSLQGAGSEEAIRVDERQIRQAVSELAKLVRPRYAIADLAEKTARLLERNLSSGKYSGFKDPADFAAVVTCDLQLASGDKLFRFGFRPADRKAQGTPPQKTEEQIKREREYWLEGLRMTNYGFQEVAVLPGNIGVLCRGKNRRPLLLKQLCDSIFFSEAQLHVRLEFVLKGDGSVEKLLINDEEGKTGAFPPERKDGEKKLP